MRKCRSCGYLLLGEGDTCARCGAPLAVVAVGAPLVASPATAEPPAAWPPSPSSSGPPPPTGAPAPPAGAAQPLPALRESWQPVAISVPVEQPRSTRLGLIVVAIVVVVAVVLGVMHFRSDPLPAGTSAFVNGSGVTYTSPDGAFQVQLPKPPTVDQRLVNVNSTQVTVYLASATTDDYAVMAASIVLPDVPTRDRVNAALDDLMNAGIAQTNGKLERKTLTMRGELPALEGRFTLPHNIHAHLLVVASGNSLIMLIVGGHSGTDRLYKALEDSLIIR